MLDYELKEHIQMLHVIFIRIFKESMVNYKKIDKYPS